MQSNLLNQTRRRETTNFVVLYPGPHCDLMARCEFASNSTLDEDDDAVIGRLLEQALSAELVESRLDAAQQCVEKSGGKCSLAWLVLAREGAESWDQARLYAEKAKTAMEIELRASDFGSYCVFTWTLGVVMVDLAQITWNAGQKSEAIHVAVSAWRDINDEFSSDDQTFVCYKAASLFVQNHQFKEAQEFHFAHPDGDEHWHYLNALIHFAIAGDTAISRAALWHAFSENAEMAECLLMKGNFEQRVCKSSNDEIAEHQQRYFVDTRPAWLAVPAALDWLQHNYCDPAFVDGRRSKTNAIFHDDLQRWERWEALMHSGEHFYETNNLGEASKSFHAALHEAERIDYDNYPFQAAVIGLLRTNRSKGKSTVDLLSKITSRLARLDKSFGGQMPALQTASFAYLFDCCGDIEEAVNYFSKASEMLVEQNKNIDSLACDLVTQMQVQYTLSADLLELDRFEEALVFALPLSEIQSRLFGPLHFENVNLLEIVYECYMKLGLFEAAAPVKEKIRYIEPVLGLYDDPPPTRR